MIAEILNAKTPEDIFGKLPKDEEARKLQASERWREIVVKIHPDVCDDPRADDAVKRLAELHEAAASGKVANPVIITTRRHGYKIDSLFAKGTVANVYLANYGDDEQALIKVVRNARDNDLMTNEAKAYKKILSNKEHFDDAQPYLGGYIETFGYRPGGKGQARQAIAMRRVEGLYTLTQVREAYPMGVHPKDMAWMMRRILLALGYVTENGLVHGGLTPNNVLIHPEHHGIVLIDFKAATEIGGEKIKMIDPAWRYMYPKAIFEKKTPDHSMDIHMAVECMKYVIGRRDIPMPLRAFFKGSQNTKVPHPWDLREEFTQLVETMWGPRTFRPFEMAAA